MSTTTSSRSHIAVIIIIAIIFLSVLFLFLLHHLLLFLLFLLLAAASVAATVAAAITVAVVVAAVVDRPSVSTSRGHFDVSHLLPGIVVSLQRFCHSPRTTAQQKCDSRRLSTLTDFPQSARPCATEGYGVIWTLVSYSYLKATIGSIFVALRAGT